MSQAAVLAPIAAEVDRVEQQLDDDERQFGLFSQPETAAGRLKLADRASRGPGRPPGARNKRTEATIAHLLGRYRDPRAVALERIQMHPADLAAILGCTVYEAAQEQRLCIQAVMPFLHARITPEVVDNRQVIHLTVNAGGGAIAGLSDMVLLPAEHSADTTAHDGVANSEADQPLGPSWPAAQEAGALSPDAAEDPS